MPQEQAVVEVVPLNEGWLKEMRRRLTGKQKGKIYPTYVNSKGESFASRVKAQEAGCVDNAPDGRSLKRKAKGAAKSKAKAKARTRASESPQPAEDADDEDCEDEDEDKSAAESCMEN